MTWTETHERHRIIREVEAAATADPTGTLPWRDEYAVYYGDRDGLLAALRHRWERTCQAQLDMHLSEEMLDERYRELHRINAGVLRILDRYAGGARVSVFAGAIARAS
jgi:hypothetical protein